MRQKLTTNILKIAKVSDLYFLARSIKTFSKITKEASLEYLFWLKKLLTFFKEILDH